MASGTARDAVVATATFVAVAESAGGEQLHAGHLTPTPASAAYARAAAVAAWPVVMDQAVLQHAA